jgi:hypothetical protein
MTCFNIPAPCFGGVVNQCVLCDFPADPEGKGTEDCVTQVGQKPYAKFRNGTGQKKTTHCQPTESEKYGSCMLQSVQLQIPH